MAYAVKYLLSFVSERGNDYKVQVLERDYQGGSVIKKLGSAPVLSIDESDGCIQGSSLSFSIQADVEGELQGLYTTDNKQYKVVLLKDDELVWVGFLLPELYSENYIDAPYDVSLTASDQIATLKALTYQKGDVDVTLKALFEDLLSLTQIHLPVCYHLQISHNPKLDLFVDKVTLSQAAYNGYNCYDVLNALLRSMNCRLMQLKGQWMIVSATDSSSNYYVNGELELREGKLLGQMGVSDVYPNGSLNMVNSPALKGATVEYSHILKNSLLNNAECTDRGGWSYLPNGGVEESLPGKKEEFGKTLLLNAWGLNPRNIANNNSLQLWQDVVIDKDESVPYSLSIKHLFSTNAKLLLLSVTHRGSDGIDRQLTGEGWVTSFNKSDVNSYIQITGSPKGLGMVGIADIEQYEESTVQFILPPIDGTLRIGFINSTANYADPLAYAPIYVTQVYLTLGDVTGSTATTVVQENATTGQESVLLVYGDAIPDSTNAARLTLNTLKRTVANTSSWWLEGQVFDSYFLMMLQEYSRFYGTKKRQLQGTIMGEDVLSNIYWDAYSGLPFRLVSAQYDLLNDEASVLLEEIVQGFVDYEPEVFATNNSASLGGASSGGSAGGAGYIPGGSGNGGGESGSGLSKVTIMTQGGEEYATNDSGIVVIPSYITASALNGYATQSWVEGKKYLTAVAWRDVSGKPSFATVATSGKYSDLSGLPTIPSAVTESTVSGWGFTKNTGTYSKPSGGIPKSDLADAVQASLGKADSALQSHQDISHLLSKNDANKTYQPIIGLSSKLSASYVDGLAIVATSGKYSDLSGLPTIPTNNNQLTNGAGYITGITSAMVTTALGYTPLSTGGGTINGSLTISRDAAVPFYIKNTQATNSLNQATLRFVIGSNYGAGLLGKSADNNLYRTDAALSASYKIIDEGNYADTTDKRYLLKTGGTITGYPAAITLQATSSRGDSWLQFTDADTTELYAIGLRRPASSYGLQYRVNDNYYNILHSNNYSSYALPLSGGTLTGDLVLGWHSSAGSKSIAFTAESGGNKAYLYADAYDLKYLFNNQYNTLIHSGNIGNQSVSYASNAGLLGGLSEGEFAKNLNNTANINIDNATSGLIGGKLYGASGTFANNYGTLNYGPFLAFGYGGYEVQISSRSHTTWLRTKENGEASNWRQLAFTDSNVASATKLQTARTIWGQSFDGTGNISGILLLNNGVAIKSKDSSGANRDVVYMTAANHIVFGTGAHDVGGDTYIGGKNLNLRYGTTPTIGMVLNSSGNVLVGTTSDNGAKLQVDGAISANGDSGSFGGYAYYWGNNNQYFLGSNSSNDFYLWATTASYLRIGTNNQERVRITSSGNVEMYGNLTATGEVISSRRASSSDRRLKNNITYLDTADCLVMIRHIRPAEWDWKDNGKHSMGFIAQDVEHLMPYAVTSIKDDLLKQKLNLQYDQFIALAIGGVKAVDNEVERLKARVEYLENKIKEYEYGNYRN